MSIEVLRAIAAFLAVMASALGFAKAVLEWRLRYAKQPKVLKPTQDEKGQIVP